MQPYELVLLFVLKCTNFTTSLLLAEGWDHVKSLCPLYTGLFMIQWLLQKATSAYPLVNLKNNLSSNCSLKLDYMKVE